MMPCSAITVDDCQNYSYLKGEVIDLNNIII